MFGNGGCIASPSLSFYFTIHLPCAALLCIVLLLIEGGDVLPYLDFSLQRFVLKCGGVLPRLLHPISRQWDGREKEG